MPRKSKPEKEVKPYVEQGNIEAHIIADMLRIESITSEIREFKDSTNRRLDKLENWIIAIVGMSFTTLVSIIIGVVLKFF